jgi:hypothetical protein
MQINRKHHQADLNVTFGDIITLLLCFFVVMVSLKRFHMLGPKTISVDATQGNTGELVIKTGTVLAWRGFEQAKQQRRKAPLRAWWFDSATVEGLLAVDVAQDRLEHRDAPDWEGLGRVVLSVCSDLPAEDAWSVAELRAERFADVLKEFGMPPEHLGIRVLGPACNALRPERPPGAIIEVLVE